MLCAHWITAVLETAMTMTLIIAALVKEMKKKIDNFIVDNRSNIIHDIVELIKIESLNGNKEKNTQALDYVMSLAEKMGMKTTKFV